MLNNVEFASLFGYVLSSLLKLLCATLYPRKGGDKAQTPWYFSKGCIPCWSNKLCVASTRSEAQKEMWWLLQK